MHTQRHAARAKLRAKGQVDTGDVPSLPNPSRGHIAWQDQQSFEEPVGRGTVVLPASLSAVPTHIHLCLGPLPPPCQPPSSLSGCPPTPERLEVQLMGDQEIVTWDGRNHTRLSSLNTTRQNITQIKMRL